jgi:hypothetical protein
MKNLEFSSLLGKTIHAFRGRRCKKTTYGKETCDFEFILLNDGETYIQLDEQDRYDYHDYSPSARHISVVSHKTLWEIMDKKE